MSGIVNKVKNALHSDTTATGAHSTHPTGTTHSTGVPEGTAGHHTSKVANAADPRIDSDLDGRAAHNTHGTHGTHTTGNNYTTGSSGLAGTGHNTTGGLTGHNTSSGLTGNTTHGAHGTTHTTGTSGLTGHNTTATGGAGPHNNSTLNKIDPRVDSDLSHTYGTDHTLGSNPHTTTGSGLTGAHNTHTTGGGLTGTSHNATGGGLTGHSTNAPHTTGLTGAGHTGNTTAGPHHNDLANKADPRIDSDLSHTGGHAHTTHAQGTHNHAGLTGASTTHAGNTSHATPGSGTATNAGPHNSALLNKIDPRVDSNLDGSKTVGGNKTHTESYAHKDVHDASQVPPSVFAAHKGEPEILHGDRTHDRAGRHGSLSHQEKHSGI